MKDLELWRRLGEGGGSPSELAAWLRQLAKLPLQSRFPWLGRLEPALEHPDAEVRTAAVAVLTGATGANVFRLLVEALDDQARSVRLAAVESLRVSAAADPARWAHAIYHPDIEIRRAALEGGCVSGSEPCLLPLLQNEDHVLRAAEQLSGRHLLPDQLELVAWPLESLGLVLKAIPSNRFKQQYKVPVPHNEQWRPISPKDEWEGGLLVTYVRPGSPAAGAFAPDEIRRDAESSDVTSAVPGIWQGDILVAIHVWETVRHEDVCFILAQADLDLSKPIRCHVIRYGKTVARHVLLREALPGRALPRSVQSATARDDDTSVADFFMRSRKSARARDQARFDADIIQQFVDQESANTGKKTVFRILGAHDFEELMLQARSDNPALVAAAVARLLELKAEHLSSLGLTEDQIASFLRQFLENDSVQSPSTRAAAARWFRSRGDNSGFPLVLVEAIGDCHLSCGLLRDANDVLVANTVTAALLAGGAIVPETWVLERLLELPDGQRKARSLADFAAEAADSTVCERAMQHLVSLRSRSWKLRALADTFAWGGQVGFKLTGKVFAIKMIAGEELGHTRLDQSRICVNPLPLLRQEENGRDIVRGLILHELGHHKYHSDPVAKAAWQRASAEKIYQLLNLVADEHLERNLRAVNRNWGHMLKRLCTYGFQHLQRDIPVVELIDALAPRAFDSLVGTRLKPARKPGCVRVASRQVLRAAEKSGNSFARFLRALRMGLGTRSSDPKVAEGLQLFGPKFRHSTMDGLLATARKLRDIFGKQVALLDLVAQDKAMVGDEHDLIVQGEGLNQADIDREIGRRHWRVCNEAASAGRPAKARVKRPSDESVEQTVALVPYDPVAQQGYTQQAAQAARLLRQFLLRTGERLRRHPRHVRGSSLDRAQIRSLVLRGDPRVLKTWKLTYAPDLFIGVLIDCSSEMEDTIERAKLFATAIAVAAKGITGIEARFVGFTHNTIYDAGDAYKPAIHGLQTGCCKNVTAALRHVADLALESKRKNRLLLVVDAPETEEDTLNSLRNATRVLAGKWHIHCAEAPVTPPTCKCFRHTILLPDGQMAKWARQFGRICVRIAR